MSHTILNKKSGNSSTKTPNTTTKCVRFPNWLLSQVNEIQKKYPNMTFSQIVVFATAKDIQRYRCDENG